jgi:hypothetical protein
MWVELCKAATVCIWTAYHCAKDISYVLCVYGKQFEVAVALNMTVCHHLDSTST